jgi:thymidylate synthase (FAD)
MTKPIVILHNYTPLWVCSNSIRKCWDSCDRSDTIHYTDSIGPKDRALIYRVALENKHGSVSEHLVYNFEIKNISRACLQELARHRIASLSVKSTRYTLKELKGESPFTEYTDLNHQEYLDNGRERAEKYLVMTEDERVNKMSILALDNLRDLLSENISNDIVKYALPESYKTELSWTVNARSLQNFLSLRTSKSALWEIRNLALEIFNQLPEDHKYLFEGML